jgi:hypothetical protein
VELLSAGMAAESGVFGDSLCFGVYVVVDFQKFVVFAGIGRNLCVVGWFVSVLSEQTTDF